MLTAPDLLVAGLRALAFVAVVHASGGAIASSIYGSALSSSGSRICKLTFSAAAAGGLLVLLHHVFEPARMAAAFSGVWDGTLQAILLESDAGTARAVRIAGLLLIALSAVTAHELRHQIGLVGAVVTLGSFILMGHTAAHPQRWLLAILLLLHLLIVAYWLGALVSLWHASKRESLATNAMLVRQFSMIAAWLVPLILVSGLAMAVMLVDDLLEVASSSYGQLLIAKLLAFAGLMALAAWNKWRLGPAVGRGDEPALRRFRRFVSAEWAIIAGVLVLTAVMTGLFGPE